MKKDKPYFRVEIENQCEFCKHGKTYAISEGDYHCDNPRREDVFLLPVRGGGNVCPHFEVDPSLPVDTCDPINEPCGECNECSIFCDVCGIWYGDEDPCEFH